MDEAVDKSPTGTGGMRALAGSFLLSTVALGFACTVAEVGFRLAGYTAIYDSYSKPSLFWVHHDELGWVHQPGATGTYVGPRPYPVEYETEIRINSLGLRGPEIEAKAPGEYRVLVLGDSVAAGFEVPYRETLVAQLERHLHRGLDVPVRVINAAVRGYGTDQELLYYTKQGRKLQADLVLLIYSGNDLNDNITLHRMRRPFGKSGFALLDAEQLEPVGQPVPRFALCSAWMLNDAYAPQRFDGIGNRLACKLQTEAADHSALFTFVAQALGRMPGLLEMLRGLGYPNSQKARKGDQPRFLVAGAAGGSPARTADASRLTSALLARLAREVRRDNADFVALIRPPHLAALDFDSLLARQIDFRQVLLPADVDPRMLHFKNDSHYNARGHHVMAQGLTPIVEAYARRKLPGVENGWNPRSTPGRYTRDMLRQP